MLQLFQLEYKFPITSKIYDLSDINKSPIQINNLTLAFYNVGSVIHEVLWHYDNLMFGLFVESPNYFVEQVDHTTNLPTHLLMDSKFIGQTLRNNFLIDLRTLKVIRDTGYWFGFKDSKKNAVIQPLPWKHTTILEGTTGFQIFEVLPKWHQIICMNQDNPTLEYDTIQIEGTVCNIKPFKPPHWFSEEFI